MTIFLLTFVLPQFAAVFKGKEAALPWPTKFLMALSDFMVHYWWCGGRRASLAVVGSILFAPDRGRAAAGGTRCKLTVPLFKSMFRALYISRSLHTMGQLVNAGVPMLDTLAITADIIGNRLYRRMWQGVYVVGEAGQEDRPAAATRARCCPRRSCR